VPSIILSSDDLETEEKLGARLAAKLGYRHVGRSLLTEVGAARGLNADKLARSLAPSARLPVTKRAALHRSFVKSAALAALVEDGVVCTGLAAHLYVRDVSHILMVRALVDPEERARALLRRDDAPPGKAERALARERARRTKWTLETFGQDEEDPAIYDMVISLTRIGPDKLAELLKDMVGYRKFQPMSYSRKCLEQQALAAAVEARLLEAHPEISVAAEGDAAIVRVRCSKRSKQATTAAIKEQACGVPGVRRVEVHAVQRARDL
jgi:cytidylate kinase